MRSTVDLKTKMKKKTNEKKKDFNEFLSVRRFFHIHTHITTSLLLCNFVNIKLKKKLFFKKNI